MVTVAIAACTKTATSSYDLVVANGRVMDPESGLDAVRHVGITAGRIAAVSETPLAGTRVIDAANHVVAPGFIDLHEHGQQEESYRMMVRAHGERYVDPDSWFQGAPRSEGSWWPAWQQWLAGRSGERVAPPATGAAGKGYAVIADAPGRYVLEG